MIFLLIHLNTALRAYYVIVNTIGGIQQWSVGVNYESCFFATSS